MKKLDQFAMTALSSILAQTDISHLLNLQLPAIRGREGNPAQTALNKELNNIANLAYSIAEHMMEVRQDIVVDESDDPINSPA